MLRGIFFSLPAGLVFMASPVFSHPAPTLPSLGVASSHEEIRTERVGDGIQYFQMRKGEALVEVEWFISFGVSRDDSEEAFVRECARTLAGPVSERAFTWPGKTPISYKELTFGSYRTRGDAEVALSAANVSEQCQARITALPMYPEQASGLWQVHVVELDPEHFSGTLGVAKGSSRIAGRMKPSGIAASADALVAVNGGYFVMDDSDGLVGEPAGLSIFGGQVQSEHSNGRPWFYFPANNANLARMGSIEHEITPRLDWSDGVSSEIDGVNRFPGKLRNCGSLHARLEVLSWHDETCYPQDQLIVLTRNAGFSIEPASDRLVAVLDEHGAPRFVRPGESTEGKMAIVATGQRKKELQDRVAIGAAAEFTASIITRLPSVTAVAGGPTLLQDGVAVRDESFEGWPFHLATRSQATSMHRFVTLRAPRTAIGVRRDGTVLLVVVDGWRFADDRTPETLLNGGVSIEELRGMLADLGAIDAMNLDGGGSSTLVVAGRVVNQPSDPDGERAVGDAVVVLPYRESKEAANGPISRH